MSIIPHSLTGADVILPSGLGRKAFLRVKYFGKKSDSICDPIKIRIPMTQAEAFAAIKEVALECQDANMRPDMQYASFNYDLLQTYDEPIQSGKLFFSFSSDIGIMNEVGLPIQVQGNVYGDTFIVSIREAGIFEGHKKGLLEPYKNYPGKYGVEFDLDKTEGKLVLDYWMPGPTPDMQWWIAYEGDAIKAGGTFYGIKKESSIRRNVEIVLS